MTTYYIGVDGGGTRCRMRLTDENMETIAEDVIDSPSNLQVRNGSAAYGSILELTDSVFAKAGLGDDAKSSAHACFGMAGARLKSARQSFAERKFPFASVEVYDDIDIAQAGAHEGGDGAVLIIGTGSAGMGLIEGKRHQIGGWGFLVGDTMSGGILGRELVRLSLLAHEGLEEATDLTRAIMARFDNDGDRLMAWSFNNPDARAEMEELHQLGYSPEPSGPVPARPADYGQFAPMVFEFADKGDPVAKRLMQFEHAAIDQYVNWFKSRGAKSIAIVGGLGQRLLPELIERHGPIMCMPKKDSMHGALILARRQIQSA
ncbi:MAG: hypothetical protein KDJ19_12515 [Hyphomicrobiaceae bacterium]|nr:hypothetical protein [Hyphomicrobiaceae bacterium]MCC0022727.1 hypothetical protein [Hyphomicrobiaceae bacterium]